MQRIALAKHCFAESGPYQHRRSLRPRLCSAPLREVLRAALRPGTIPDDADEKNFAFLIPVPRTCLILRVSWPMRGSFLEAIFQRAERKLAGPGPDQSTAWWPVERREALRLALGARGCLAARGGSVNPASGVLRHCTLAPPAAPSPRADCARDGQTSDALRRENAGVWLCENLNRKS